jgi:tRNA G18 (ribose-2'-O)-methylase SpoU
MALVGGIGQPPRGFTSWGFGSSGDMVAERTLFESATSREPIALVLGAEGHGLLEADPSALRPVVRIPLVGPLSR